MATIQIADRIFKLATLDFETFYSTEYTLRKSSMSGYIRDPRFKAHGVGLLQNSDYQWITDDIGTRLKMVDWENTALIGHNTLFDCYILAQHYGIYPGFVIDTQAMSRMYFGVGYKHNLNDLSQRVGGRGKTLANNLVNTKNLRDLSDDLLSALGKYCREDCENTYAAFEYLYPHVPDTELKLIDLSTRLFTKSPLKVNLALAEEELAYEKVKKHELVTIAGVTPEQLSSNQQFAELLKHMGVTPPTKLSKRTGLTTFAFAKNDLGFQQMLEDDDPVVVALCEARQAVKSSINETRAQRLIEEGTGGKRLPVGLNHAAAKTHRWGGTNKMNLQNLQRQNYLSNGDLDLDTGRLRRSIEVDEGYVIVVNDSSQIEVRLSAWWSGQKDLMEDFRNKIDIYKKMAMRVFNKPEHLISKAERFVGKCLILGLGYGMGAAKLQMTLALGLLGGKVHITMVEAQRYVDIYRSTFRFITNGWKICDAMIQIMIHGGSYTHNGVTATKDQLSFPNGTRIYYRHIRYDSNGEIVYRARSGYVRIYGAILYENIIQKLSRDVIAEQLTIVDEVHKIQVISMTHDEISALSHEETAQQTLDTIATVMNTPPSWCADVPLASEGGWARNYSK